MKTLLLTAAAMTAATSAAAQVTNGGFEAPVVGGPCCTTTPPDPLPGWTVTEGDANVVAGTFSSTNGNLAYEGDQYLDLVGQSGSGGITQAVATTAGLSYEFSFAFSHNLFAGLAAASASYSIGGLTGVVTHSTGSTSDLDWTVLTGRFVATGPTTTFSFTNLTGGQNEGVLLDGISLSAVPEPATWALMILGFGAVGAAMRRRRAVPALA